MTIPLFPFQQEDVDKLAAVQSALDASDMGTGKTYKGIAIDLAHRGNGSKGPTLVIAPLSTLGMWEDKYNELAPELKTYRVNPTSKKTREWIYDANADVYIVHWDALRLLPGLKDRTWHFIIADECHRAQNRKAQQTTALKRLKAEHRLGLSGTPVTSRPEKYCSILNWLYPKDPYYRSYWRFYNKHVNYHVENSASASYHVIDGYKDLDLLLERVEPFYVRHLKKTQCCDHHPKGVLPELPDKYYTTLHVDLHPEQRRAYREMAKTQVAWVGENQDKPVIAPIAIARVTRLQQFAVGYADVNANGDVRLSEPSSKLDALMQLLDDNPGEQFVVFSQFKQLVNLLAVRLSNAKIPHVILTGDTDQATRTQIIKKFQAGEARVFAGTIAAGGVGITLHAASTVVMLDRMAGTPSLNFQAEDRCWRIGQDNAVQVIDIMARNTVDRDRAAKLEMTWGWLQKLFGDTP